MATKRYVTISGGKRVLEVPIITSAGSGDSGKMVALDAGGHWDTSVMPTGIGAETYSAVASENLAAGDHVNFWTNSGATNVRKADGGTTGKEVHGFVLAAFTSSQTATVYALGNNTQVSGLTPGGTCWLSQSTPGGVTQTAPDETVTGKTIQIIGVAISATSLAVHPNAPVAT